MDILDNYNKVLEELYNYFGFKEDWTVYPIDDAREYFWEMDSTEVKFYDTKEAYEQQDDNHTYSNEIMRHRFYPKAVYEGKDFTMIMVDTHTDGNKFLQIFDNSKRVGVV
jgi:hypothetical protein